VTGVNGSGVPTDGVLLLAGSSAWSVISDSTLKRNIRPVDPADMLERVARLPIKRWSYKAQDPSIEHIGPMAQDFYALFGLDVSEHTISTIDPPGVALAAIQELYLITQRQAAEIASLKKDLQALRDSAAGPGCLETHTRAEGDPRFTQASSAISSIGGETKP
jgi:hypothetical protein